MGYRSTGWFMLPRSATVELERRHRDQMEREHRKRIVDKEEAEEAGKHFIYAQTKPWDSLTGFNEVELFERDGREYVRYDFDGWKWYSGYPFPALVETMIYNVADPDIVVEDKEEAWLEVSPILEGVLGINQPTLMGWELEPDISAFARTGEDWNDIEVLDELTPFLRENSDIGGVRASIGDTPGFACPQAHTYYEQFYEKGETSIKTFGLTGNYISGQIYNGPLLKQLNIPQRLQKNIYANRHYPHLYLNILTAANARTLISSKIVCYQGADEPYLRTQTYRDNPIDYFGTFSYGNRSDQLVSLRDALFEGFQDLVKSHHDEKFNAKGFYTAYCSLCEKYMRIVCISQGNLYKDELFNLDALSTAFCLFCISVVADFPFFEVYKDQIADNIIKSNQKWLNQKKEIDLEFFQQKSLSDQLRIKFNKSA